MGGRGGGARRLRSGGAVGLRRGKDRGGGRQKKNINFKSQPITSLFHHFLQRPHTYPICAISRFPDFQIIKNHSAFLILPCCLAKGKGKGKG